MGKTDLDEECPRLQREELGDLFDVRPSLFREPQGMGLVSRC